MIPVQWAFSVDVPPNTDISLEGRNPNSVKSERFPYTVPKGYDLGISGANLGCKMSEVASYFVILGVQAVPSNVGQMTWDPPFIVPEGTVIHAHLINNHFSWSQWMVGTMVGWLIPREG